MPKFSKGDRVRIRFDSHSPYRGQIGVVDDDPSVYSLPSKDSSGLWYMVRFEREGLRPAARFMEEDLEPVTDETLAAQTSVTAKVTDQRRRGGRGGITNVSARTRYSLIALAVILTLALVIVVSGRIMKSGSETPSGASVAPGKPPSLVEPETTMKLAFVTELAEATAGLPFPVSPVVNIVDVNGEIVTDSAASVTLIVTDYRATLYGTTTVNAVNGVATFNDLSIRLAGSHYSLTAISPGITSALSNSFDVVPGVATKLVFTKVPSRFDAGSTLTNEVKANITDTYGNTVTTSTAPVTIDITPGTGTSGAVLSGTKTVNAVNGVATWAHLSIDLPGYNYTLTATSPGLAPAVSSSFNVYRAKPQ